MMCASKRANSSSLVEEESPSVNKTANTSKCAYLEVFWYLRIALHLLVSTRMCRLLCVFIARVRCRKFNRVNFQTWTLLRLETALRTELWPKIEWLRQIYNYLCKYKKSACISHRIRVSETVAITVAISVHTRAIMSMHMYTSFLTVDQNGLVKSMFVQSVFPHHCLKVLQTEVLLTAFDGCILRGLVHVNTSCLLSAFRVRM